MANLKDLQYTKADKREQKVEMDMPENQYSYGLRIRLEKPELDKLGITKLPEIGDEYHMMAVGRVINVYQETREQDQDSKAIGIQIQFLELFDEGQEPDEGETADEENKESGNLMKVKGTVTSYYKGGK